MSLRMNQSSNNSIPSTIGEAVLSYHQTCNLLHFTKIRRVAHVMIANKCMECYGGFTLKWSNFLKSLTGL